MKLTILIFFTSSLLNWCVIAKESKGYDVLIVEPEMDAGIEWGYDHADNMFSKAWRRLTKEKENKFSQDKFEEFRLKYLKCLEIKDKTCIQKYLSNELYFPYMLNNQELKSCTSESEPRQIILEHGEMGEMIKLSGMDTTNLPRKKVILKAEDYTNCLLSDFKIGGADKNGVKLSALELLISIFQTGEVTFYKTTYFENYYTLSYWYSEHNSHQTTPSHYGHAYGECLLYYDENVKDDQRWEIVGCYDINGHSMAKYLQEKFYKSPFRKIVKTLYALLVLKD